MLWLPVSFRRLLFAICFGFAYGGLSAVIAPLAADLFGVRSLSQITGGVGFAWTIGGALGPAIAGYIYDVNHSYQLAFIICLAFCILGLVSTSLLRPVLK